MVKAAVIGGAGYAGAELVRLIARHPEFELIAVTSDADAGNPIADTYPALLGVEPACFTPHDDPAVLDCDVAFLAVPHTAGMHHAARLVAAGVTVVDLSADFRLPQDVYEAAYNVEHTAADLLEGAAYGQPELNHAALDALAAKHAEGEPVVVGCAGCYPTAVSLAAVPAVRAGLVSGTVIADCISGISGAGKKPTYKTHYCSANEDAQAYGLPLHRHAPEMDMELEMAWSQGENEGAAPKILFTPHLAPLARGMVATLHLPVTTEDVDWQKLYEDAYAGNPFVHVLPAGKSPRTSSVAGTNNAHIGVFPNRGNGYVTVISTIDNLGKGAAAQAIQCANIIFGFDETAGLEGMARAL
ncbi:N-acetyl-gamma-glutamyl-phosphate reductase [Slackia heliotrinireducens]|uniref:N-acetyl-gamma-glutamyl-phosphate reductase n=1 Tax=Slackia heliotrinireducens (strain ATCC 29202 / DSM 20476 / NCTC 11029 / RHS 1) TaxID=471855 RepID=C7N0Y8_SLAHD|nr:N-acetyl-gamma-glutamyl-phosphate reductase [Slackia heliotrinireducens]ACV23210.1 N-acetyl-gamma-glutamyl-phosphate reductase, common form [Slackia heliotrinireducens DSM 20476]VEH02311.1 N-acetyl-gamma-glutamyl-phosphate reductase [Slackia heliotrinireducens]